MKQIIVMRTDLNMRKGKMIAQGAHASLAATIGNIEHKYVKEWLNSSFTKIAVGIGSEQELLALWQKAADKSMITARITDNGKTEFNGVKTLTCMAIGPAPDEMFLGLTDHLKLL